MYKPGEMGNAHIVGIGQIAIPVRDLERAVAFYRDVLGLKFLFRAPPGMAFLECGGVRLLLGAAQAADAECPGSIVYFSTDDIQDAFRALGEAGVAIMEPPRLIAQLAQHDLWMGFFRDSEGNTMSLMSEVAHP